MWKALQQFLRPSDMNQAASSSSTVPAPGTVGQEKTAVQISVHPRTHRPTKCWNELQHQQKVRKVAQLPTDTPVKPDKVRFVCMSDTHNKTYNMRNPVPPGDVLLHAGDFTTVGHPNQIEEFNGFLGTLPHKHKIVIAGNHDLTFDKAFLGPKADALPQFGMQLKDIQKFMASYNIEHMSELLTNCTAYLEDSLTEVYGLRIYGSPWQPEFCGWGFNLERGQDCLEKWNLIPEGVDVLMTHGPPLGHGDMCFSQNRAGCVELLNTIQHRVKPKYHVFGHIHEGYGITTDGCTTYINASTCTIHYKAANRPIIFDLPLPPGHSKEEA